MPTTKKTPSPKKAAATSVATEPAASVPTGELPILAFTDQASLATWLAANHETSRGVWLRLAKKASGRASVTYAEAVDVALAWGWIDGQKRLGDAGSWLQKLCPRGARSMWSKINREKVAKLVAAGEMKPSGLAEVDRAKRDGRWDAAYDAPSRATVPEDLAAALAANAEAAAFFATLDAANRYAVLFRVQAPKKPETRAKRIEQFIAMLARHERIHEPRTRVSGAPSGLKRRGDTSV